MGEAIAFWKLTAAGNDFVCFDNRDGRFDRLIADPPAAGHFARTICRRGHGIGADGVIFASLPGGAGGADIGAAVFEADGSPCELCGNGTACLTRFVIAVHLMPDRKLRIFTPAGEVEGHRTTGDYVRVCIPAPTDLRKDLMLEVEGRRVTCDFVITGIPHVVTYVDDIAAADVGGLGFALRHHEAFQPRGANANFVQVLGEGEIAVRTFEFGVEGETLACGTGSSASAILAALRFGWNGAIRSRRQPVVVHSHSGEILRVYFRVDGDTASDVCLETPVRRVMHGRLSDDFAAEALTI
jgi:diaminopimelate epimerase